MTHTDTLTTVEEGLAAIPLLDVHTHLDAAHLAARGLHDVLLYHMVISDLVSAGCPSRARLSEDPDEAEAQARLAEAVPYLRHIQQHQHVLGRADHPARPVRLDRAGHGGQLARGCDALIRERAADAAWPREILRARRRPARRHRAVARARRRRPTTCLQYSLEWAFFTRAQWGVNDIPLYELERAWEQEPPGAPLPVTMGEGRPPVRGRSGRVEDARAAIAHYVARIPYGKVLSTAQHISTDITFRAGDRREMAAALATARRPRPADRDVYASSSSRPS